MRVRRGRRKLTLHATRLILGVAFTKAMLDPKPTKNHAYKFQRIFTDGDFMAGGVLVIPPGEAKPLKPARDNTYVSQTRVSINGYPV